MIIPASIPTVLAGLRLGGALAIIGVVVSEMLTSVGRHRLSRDAVPHHARQPARVRRHPDDPACCRCCSTCSRAAVERRTLVWQTAGRRERGAPGP